VWKYKTDGMVDPSSPVVASGVVYVGSKDDNVYAFGTHDVAVNNVPCSKTVVGQGFSAGINVTVANQGDYVETFNVTLLANATIIGSESFALPAGNSMTVAFAWNTTGFAFGNYTLSAYAQLAPGKTNAASTFVGGVVTVTIPGDVNGEGKVDMGDVVTILRAFGSTTGTPNYNPNCDLEDNGRLTWETWLSPYATSANTTHNPIFLALTP
jgi:hypothetical protein